jgi:hypothetical protein
MSGAIKTANDLGAPGMKPDPKSMLDQIGGPPDPSAPNPYMSWLMSALGMGPSQPATVHGERLAHYPDQADVANARKSDFSYGSGNEAFNEGRVANVLAGPAGKGKFEAVGIPPGGAKASQVTAPSLGHAVPGTPDTAQGYEAAQLAILRSPIAALGYDPRNTNLDVKTGPGMSIAGVYTPETNSVYSNAAYPSNIVHESTHRGLETLRKAGLIPKELQDRLPQTEENIVRYIMALHMGDPEGGRGDESDKQRGNALWMFGKKPDDPQAYSRQGSYDAPKYRQALEDLNAIAAKYLASRKPGGPR